MNSKSWHKSKKLWIAVGTILLIVITKLIPVIPEIVITSILALGISLITGHTFTDIAALLRKK